MVCLLSHRRDHRRRALSQTGVLPTGVTFVDNHNGTGTVAGAPTAGGVFVINLIATNSSGSSSQSFTLTVSQAPSISSANNSSFGVGTASSFNVTTAGYPAPVITESGALPQA